jgi:hypothetical protein
MSIDYNFCEKCQECIIDDQCQIRILNGEEITLCNNCLNKLIKSEAIFEVNEDNSDEYDFLLTEKQEDDISYYECIYISAPVHLKELITEKEKLIKKLEDDIYKLKAKLEV